MESFKCLGPALEPLDQVDGHTLSSVSLASVGCPDPALLSNIFQEAPCHSSPDTLLVPLQDAIDITTSYSVYSSGQQFSIPSQHYDPELATVSVTVPELAYPLGDQDAVTLTVPEPLLPSSESCHHDRLGVLARTWTPALGSFLTRGLWTDTDIVCRGGLALPCHRLLLAASSPLLSACLGAADSWPDRSCLVLPDFSAEEVRQFLDILYLKNLGDDTFPLDSQLVHFFSEAQPTEEHRSEPQENVKNEEKCKKMPVEVKMEESIENGGGPLKKLLGNSSSGHKIKGPHTCEKCGKTFKLNRILKEHMGLHEAPRFPCEVEGCKRKFHLKANLKAHVEVVHLKTKTVPCNICGKLFYNQTHLRSHMEHHNTDKHVCEHCSSYFSCSKSLRDHIKFKHSRPENLPKCTICNKTYSTPQNLKSHIARVHMQEKKYICSECGRSFFEKAELDFHLSSHNTKDQNIQCDVCKLMFKNTKTLYYHKKRSHDPTNKIHICYQCGKSYTDSHHLNRHMESHGQKSSFCKTCGKAFQSEQKVKAHIRKVHEKWRRSDDTEKPCALCNKKFPNFGSMKRHLKDVHKLSVTEANTILVDRFSLDPKKHRINPSEVFSVSIQQDNDA